MLKWSVLLCILMLHVSALYVLLLDDIVFMALAVLFMLSYVYFAYLIYIVVILSVCVVLCVRAVLTV